MNEDVEALANLLRAHLPKDRYDDGKHVGTYCSCGGWEGDYFADGEAGPFDDHLASALAAHVHAARADDAATIEVLASALQDASTPTMSKADVVAWARREAAALRAPAAARDNAGGVVSDAPWCPECGPSCPLRGMGKPNGGRMSETASESDPS